MAATSAADVQTLPGMEPETRPASADEDAPLVAKVWGHYEETFRDRLRVKTLTQPRERTIRKALKAVSRDSELLCRAITGLKLYREANPQGSKDIGLSVIFETGPHSGRNLVDQIEWWASQAEDGTYIGPKNPSVTSDRINRRRLQVIEMYQQPNNSGARERGLEAEQWLREHAKEEPIVQDEDGKVTGWKQVA